MKSDQKKTGKWRCLPFILIFLMLTSLSCEATPEPFASEGVTTYMEATKWVKKNYKSEIVKPDSSIIHKMVYFSEGKFMLIYFQSNKGNGYLYHQVSKKLWVKFKNAPSQGRFYNAYIKGNKNIYLKLKK